MRVLLVDDDYVSRLIVTKALSDFGHIDTFSTGAEAKEALLLSYERCLPYDLLVIDGFLPDTFGWTIVKELREKEASRNVKNPLNIIITSGCDDSQGISSKFNLIWFTKPLDINLLIEAVSVYKEATNKVS